MVCANLFLSVQHGVILDKSLSYLQSANLAEIEGAYQRFKEDPSSVDSSWRYFFEGMEVAHPLQESQSDVRIYWLVEAYRNQGHLKAPINPIELTEENQDFFALKRFGLSEKDLTRLVPTFGVLQKETAPLSELIDHLEKTYCQRVGVECAHLESQEMRQWLFDKLEKSELFKLSLDRKREILLQLNNAEVFETFLHTRYVGQKRFSLEGLETLIPLLAAVVQECGRKNYKELLIGMAHRGRLNVLANILKKSYSDIFSEFEDIQEKEMVEGDGDVKYHKGFSTTIQTSSKNPLSLSLISNPSHLESVNPVLLGKTHAKQIKHGDSKGEYFCPVNIHGDSAIAGQGVVYESLQFSKLEGYQTFGTLHIVLNNQIGFTTLPEEYRSTRYSTDIAKTFSSPVFHLNAEDPEACVSIALLALEMRQRFKCDVFLEINGYRKYGHNETDEPSFTQPIHYQKIKKKETIRSHYTHELVKQGIVEKEMALEMEKKFRQELDFALNQLKLSPQASQVDAFGGDWQGLHAPRFTEIFNHVDTAVDVGSLKQIMQKLCEVPKDFEIHKKLAKLLEERLQRLESTIDWAIAEQLAFGSLLIEGRDVRLSGQDCGRGTFAHRHALLVDQTNQKRYYPLDHVGENQGRFTVLNSPLSEFGVLGFEFGFSLASPHTLVLWEAQFGDFANGAQVIIDQYLTASGSKWSRFSGLVLLLPHGYEGQGAEHSSARLERYLQLAGDLNLQVVNPTLPSQYFHLLRRQLVRPFRLPLIVMSPKMLLRHPQCISSLKDLSQGSFEEILDDPLQPVEATRALLCSGKIYFDLLQEREQRGCTDKCVIVRVEQLYPLHEGRLQEILSTYSKLNEVVWVQEEPENMGAWSYILPFLSKLIKIPLLFVARRRGSATATGSFKRHCAEQKKLIDQAFEGL